MEQNSIKLTSVDDVVNFFIATPHCSLTMEQLAETAFKIAEKRNIESIVTIVPNNIIDIALDIFKKVGKEIVSYYDLELEDYEEAVKSNYDKEYAIWIDFNAYDDSKYRLGVELPYHNNSYYNYRDLQLLIHKDTSKEMLNNISDTNKIVTFDLLA